MEAVRIPAVRAKGARGARAEGLWACSHHTSTKGLLVWAQPLEKVEQGGIREEGRKEKKNQQETVVKYTEPETGDKKMNSMEDRELVS